MANNQLSPRVRYRKDLDGLRGVLVLIVVAVHCFPDLIPNSPVAMDIFFAISGFLITTYALVDLQSNKFSFAHFYVRRIKRIFPMVIVVLGIVALVGALTLFDEEFNVLRIHIRAVSAFYFNFHLIRDKSEYFSIDSTYKPLLHFWSLAIEEQFYIIWPLILVMLFRAGLYFERIRKLNKLTVLAVPTAIMICLSLWSSLYWGWDSPLYFSTFGRAWTILAGCLTAIVCSRVKGEKKNRFDSLIATVGTFAMFGSMFLQSKAVGSIAAVTGAALFIYSGEENLIKMPFRSKALVLLGLMSYAFYLIHWPALSFFRIYKTAITANETILIALGAFLLSCLAYIFIEKPIRSQRWELDFSFQQLPQFRFSKKAVICILLMATLFLSSAFLPKLPDVVTSHYIKTELRDIPHENECVVGHWPENGVPWCFKEKSDEKVEGIIFGDSGPYSLFTALAGKEDGIRWQLVSKEVCSPFITDGDYPECLELETKIYRDLKEDPKIKVAVLMLSFPVFSFHPEQYKKEERLEVFVKNLKEIEESGKKIIIVAPTPSIAPNVYACIKQRFSFHKIFDPTDVCRVPYKEWKERSRAQFDFIDELKRRIPTILVVDATSSICDNDFCTVVRDGELFYKDKDHLSYYGGSVIAKKIMEVIPAEVFR